MNVTTIDVPSVDFARHTCPCHGVQVRMRNPGSRKRAGFWPMTVWSLSCILPGRRSFTMRRADSCMTSDVQLLVAVDAGQVLRGEFAAGAKQCSENVVGVTCT